MERTMRIAINGFGRIGRCLLRAIQERDVDHTIDIAAINSPGSPRNLAHLLKYDSTYGTLPYEVSWEPDTIICRGQRIPSLNEPASSRIDWSAFEIDLMIDCSGEA